MNIVGVSYLVVFNFCVCWSLEDQDLLTSRIVTGETTAGMNGYSTPQPARYPSNVSDLLASPVTSLPLDDDTDDAVELTALEQSLLLSQDQTDFALDVLQYMYYVAAISAIPPTLINILVFFRPSMRSGTSTYVIGLSVAQLLYVLCVAGLQLVKVSVTHWPHSALYWTYYVYVSGYGGLAAKRCGYVILCLVSVERLHAIVRPLHARTFFLSRRSVPVVCLAFLLTFLCHVYIPCRTSVRQAGTSPQGDPIYRPVRTQLYQDTRHVNDAFSLAAKILLSFSTLLLQLLLNVLTICALLRHNMAAKRVQSSADEAGRAQRQRQMTVTILAASVSYVLLSLPSVLHNLMYTLYPQEYGHRFSNLYRVMNALSRNLTNFSAGIDFVWFLTLSSAYRREFFRLFGCRQTQVSGSALSKIDQTETEATST